MIGAIKHLLLFGLLFLGCSGEVLKTGEQKSSLVSAPASTVSGLERVSRQSSVKIYVLNDSSVGHGSGTYFVYRDQHFVLTAYHVTEGGQNIIGELGDFILPLTPFVHNELSDIAILTVSPYPNAKPFKLRLASQNNIKIGQRVLYTGYPNLTGPLTIYGTVAGFSVDNSIILQSYAWGGASGSAVLDYKGRLIGVVNGIEVVMSMTGLPSENENVILIKRFEEDLLRHVDFLLDN